MPEVYLDADELYPDYTLTTEPSSRYQIEPVGELTDEEIEDWRRVRREYAAWNKRLAEMEEAYWGKKRWAAND